MCIYLTVRTGDGFARSGDPASVVGVLAIVAEPDVLTHEERTLADAIVSEGELALDRARAMEAREEAAVLAKNEQLHANLLRSISHDLRTPLTSISGNADVLLDQGSTGTAVLDAQTRRGLLLSIRSDAQWLNATVENLLAITKLEGGGMHLSTTLELMDDIVEEALRHVSPAVREHDLKVVPCERAGARQRRCAPDGAAGGQSGEQRHHLYTRRLAYRDFDWRRRWTRGVLGGR